MNNLKAIMEARCLTATDLSQMTGISVSNIRRLMEEDHIETAYKHTQQMVAAALGLTVRDLVVGGEDMKNKILEAEVTKTIQSLVKALRKYSDEGLYISFFAFTHDTDSADTPGDVPDYYSIRIHKAEEDELGDFDNIYNEAGRIFYSVVDGEEGIRKVIPYRKESKHE